VRIDRGEHRTRKSKLVLLCVGAGDDQLGNLGLFVGAGEIGFGFLSGNLLGVAVGGGPAPCHR
jgi:hypothetical protein